MPRSRIQLPARRKPLEQHLARLIARLTTGSVRRAHGVVLALLALTAATVLYVAGNLALVGGTEQMLDPSLEFRRTAQEFKQRFPELADNLVIVIEAAAPEAARSAAAAAVEAVEGLDAVAGIFWYGGAFFDRHGLLFLEPEALARRIDLLAEIQPFLATLAEQPTLTALFELLAVAATDAAAEAPSLDGLGRALAAIAATVETVEAGAPQPLSWERLLDGSGDATPHRELVFVQPRLDRARLAPGRAALEAVRAATTDAVAGLPDNVEVGFTGAAAINAEELDGVARDAALAGGLSAGLVALVLLVGLGTWQLVVAALLTLAVGLVLTAGFTILAIGSFNIISVTFAVLFIGLGIDYAIHLLLRCREALGSGASPAAGLARASGRVGSALLLCMASTALAFLAFTPTAYQGLAQLGLISAVGVVISCSLAFTLLPALLMLLPQPRAAPALRPRQPLPRVGWLASSGGGSADGWWLASTAILALAAVATLPAVRFDADPIRLKDPASPAMRSFEALRESAVGSPYTLEVLADGEDTAAGLAERLAAIPGVEQVRWLESFVPRDQSEKLAILDDASFFLHFPAPTPLAAVETDMAALEAALGELRAALGELAAAGLAESTAAARLLAGLDRLFAAGPTPAAAATLRDALLHYFPFTLERLRLALETGPVGVDDLPAALLRRYVAPGPVYRLAVEPRAAPADVAGLRPLIEAVEDVAERVTGSPIQILRAGAVVVEAMLVATGLALLLVVLLLAMVLRRPGELALILAPVLLAGLLTLAATVWLGIPFNFANVIVLPLLIGLGVDSAIHLVMRRRSLAAARDLAATSTPRAVLLSAATTLSSFGTLGLAGHRGLASMGQLLAVAIIAILFAMLVFLPALLRRVDRWSGSKQRH